jgi:hypothetical protein
MTSKTSNKYAPEVRASEPVGSFEHRGVSVETTAALDHRLEFYRSRQGRTDGRPK